MKKLRNGSEIACRGLREAYSRAGHKAMDNMGGTPEGYQYAERYGNQVATKGTGFCTRVCTNPACFKKVKVTYTAPKIEVQVRDNVTWELSETTAYNPLMSKETVQISGNRCKTGEQKR